MPAAPAAVSISSVSATCAATITLWVRLPCALPITRRVLVCTTRADVRPRKLQRRRDAEHDRGGERPGRR